MTLPAIEFFGVTKSYGNLVAVNAVDLTLQKGEILGLVGENGAGKSTIIKIAAGLISPDSGLLSVNGHKAPDHTPQTAQHYGIGVIHQTSQIIPELTVMDNIVLGQEPAKYHFFIDRKTASSEIKLLLDRIGNRNLNLHKKAGELDPGEIQHVEILKTLYRKAEIIMFDEPTTLLPPDMIDHFLDLVRSLKQSGVSVLFVSHRLSDVCAVSDRVAVMRQGKLVDVVSGPDFDEKQLIDLQTGDRSLSRSIFDAQHHEHVIPESDQEPCIELQNVSTESASRIPLRNVSLEIRSGEIVGLIGVTGNGQRELVDVLLGLTPPLSGSLRRCGHSPVIEKADGDRLAYIPSDVEVRSFAPSLNLVENILIGHQSERKWSRYGLLRWDDIRQWCLESIRDCQIKANSPDQTLSELSGGNRQKLLLAREMKRASRLFVAEYPLKGLDISAQKEVIGAFRNFKAEGGGVLLVHNEIDDLYNLCSRIYAIQGGRITRVFHPPYPPQAELVKAMVAKTVTASTEDKNL